MLVSMITTTDNPFDPFDEFDEWLAFDTAKGYNTCSYLARISKTSPEMSPEEEMESINNAINEIISLNVLGIYKKIVKKVA